MKFVKAVLLFVCLNVSAESVFAWGTTGHRVIAEVAERNLSKKARKHLHRLIGKEKLAYWANWADFLKSDTTGKWDHTTGSWHYINIPQNLPRAQFEQAVAAFPQQSVYTQIPYLKNKVATKSLPAQERKDALAFLVHMVADMHQPMHVGRPEDLGGNKVQVNWFGKPTNLHTLWDSELIDFQKWSYTEYATILDTKSATEKKNIQQGLLIDWLYESYTLTNEVYARTPFGANLSYDYNYIFVDKMNAQLYRGGLRLAKILNEVL